MNFVLASIFIGSFAAAIYIYLQARSRKFPKLTNMVILFMSSGGVAAGIKVCSLAYYSALFNSGIEDNLYIFIGGVSVTYVSIQAILQALGVQFEDDV